MGAGDDVRLRPFDATDIDWWIDLRMRIDPSMGEAALRRVAEGGAVRFERRTIAEVGGARAGVATAARPVDEVRPSLLVAVDAPFQDRGVGSMLFADCWPSVAHDPEVTAFLVDADTRSLEVARHWGFEAVSHGILSRLRALPATPPTVPAGTTLIVVDDTVGATPAEDALLARLVDESDTSPERVELGWNTTPAMFRRFFASMVWVVAVVDGVPAAMTSGAPRPDGGWTIIYSGTRPDHRGRGLARLVKDALHAEVRRRGGTDVETMNEERNVAIRALNASLGYEAVSGEYRLRRVNVG
jgi:GNAT superfamily N-acetyltransferase